MNRLMLLSLAGCALLLPAVCASTGRQRLLGEADDKLVCRVTLSTLMETLCIPILDDGTESDAVVPMSLQHDELDSEAQRRLVDGSFYVEVEGMSVDDYFHQGGIAANATISNLSSFNQSQIASTSHPTRGTLSVMIVRVTSADGFAPSASLQELRQQVFGRAVSMASQYKACSFGKLQFREARSLDIRLPRSRSFYTSPSDLAAAAETTVKTLLNVDSITDVADKVIFCQPPDNLPWTSVAVQNHWRINMKDGFCTSLSGLTHEMGHSIGMLHSGIGSQQYGDASGFMVSNLTSKVARNGRITPH